MVEDSCEGWALNKWLRLWLLALALASAAEAGKKSWPSGSHCSGSMMSKRRHRAASGIRSQFRLGLEDRQGPLGHHATAVGVHRNRSENGSIDIH